MDLLAWLSVMDNLSCHVCSVDVGSLDTEREKFCIDTGNEKYTCEWSEGGHGST
jgi:hypothetical protein